MENDILDADLQTTERLVPASFGRRFSASLLDGLLVSIPLQLGVLYGMIGKNFALTMLLLLIAILYKPVTEGQFGATLGKYILGLKVTDMNFNLVDMGQSFTKNAIYIISGVLSTIPAYLLFQNEDFLESSADGFLESYVEIGQLQQETSNMGLTIGSVVIGVLILISCLMMLNDKENGQTLHDKIAGTLCVKKGGY